MVVLLICVGGYVFIFMYMMLEGRIYEIFCGVDYGGGDIGVLF